MQTLLYYSTNSTLLHASNRSISEATRTVFAIDSIRLVILDNGGDKASDCALAFTAQIP